LGKAADGADLTVIGRDESGDWLVISRADLPQGEGWVAAQFIKLAQPASELPVMEAPPAPAPTPVPAATPASDASAADATSRATTPAAREQAGDASLADQEQQLKAIAGIGESPSAINAEPVSGLGGKIVFQDGRNNIYVYDLASGDVRFLTNGFDPDVNTAGDKVVFVRGGGVDNGIWSINMDGSDLRMVYGTGELLNSPKWSPDSDYIVFSRNSGSYKCFDLTPFLGCISFKQLQSQFPKIPPYILYKIFLSGADRLEFPNWGISRVAPDGSEFRDINALDSAVAPDWNEAGIVYQSTAGLEITEDTPDGRTRSVFHGDWDWDPDWQPGGGRILYQSKEGSHWEIWSVTPEGGDIFALTRPETTLVDQLPSNVSPAWSPDGKNVVYVSNRMDDEEAGPWRLWVMDAGGGNKRPLPIDITIDYGFDGAQIASWAK
jgi:hypothetical protein